MFRIPGFLGLAIVLAGCQRAEDPVAATAPEPSPVREVRAMDIEVIPARHLPNPVRVHETVISGGLPEGDAAFAELKAMGIRTVISVDGAKPDVKTAGKYGLRYVHLPHGYSGVPDELGPVLAKAVRDLPGPIYVHCHHGKHRSPAAAAVACLGAGLIDRDAARKVLAVAGTGKNYRGLFESVEKADPVPGPALDALVADFPETARLPAMAEAMVQIEHLHDHLKLLEKSGWKTPEDQPALTAPHESLLLREQFTELLRTPDLQRRPESFRQLTREAEELARSLEDSLASSAQDRDAVSRAFAAVTANCKACHQQFRDVPQAR